MSDTPDVSRREQVQALVRAAKFRPKLTIGIIVGGVFAALLEGVGLSFHRANHRDRLKSLLCDARTMPEL